MNVNVLPDMDEPRLKVLCKQLNRSRKANIISRDYLGERCDVYVKSLNKAQRSLDWKFNTKSTRLKKNLARVRGTQKVLRSRREQSFWEDSEEFPYGLYEGEKLDSLKREVDNVIEQKHPKYRRQKKVQQHLRAGRTMGMILDDADARGQFNTIMSKDRNSQFHIRENPLTHAYFHMVKPNKIEAFLNNLNAAKKVQNKNKKQMFDKPRSDASIKNEANAKRNQVVQTDRVHNPRVEKLKRESERFLLTESGVYTPNNFSDDVYPPSKHALFNLPPITSKRCKEQSKLTFPDLTIRRLIKGDVARSKDQTKLEALKGRRATTFVF